MAQDDMNVVMYRILAYLYRCMRDGERPVDGLYSAETLGIPSGYWNDIMAELIERGYIKGATAVTAWGGDTIIKLARPVVTLDGVDFMQSNSAMQRAADFLRDAKSAIPFL